MYEIMDAPCDVIEKLNQEAAAHETEWSPLIAWISHSTKFIGRLRAWMGSASGHPKTCTDSDRCCAPRRERPSRRAAPMSNDYGDAALQSRLMDRPVYFLKVAPVSCAIAPSVVCAALRPSRKSLSEYDV